MPLSSTVICPVAKRCNTAIAKLLFDCIFNYIYHHFNWTGINICPLLDNQQHRDPTGVQTRCCASWYGRSVWWTWDGPQPDSIAFFILWQGCPNKVRKINSVFVQYLEMFSFHAECIFSQCILDLLWPDWALQNPFFCITSISPSQS